MTIAISNRNYNININTSKGLSGFSCPIWTAWVSNMSFLGRLHSGLNIYSSVHTDSYQTVIVTKEIKSLDQEYIKNLSRLEDIQKLEDNWNENSAPSFPANQIDMMRNILGLLQVQPFVTPTANKSIQFEYEDEDGNYLEFELFSDGKIKMFKYDSDGNKKTEFITVGKVMEEVDDFHRRTAER